MHGVWSAPIEAQSSKTKRWQWHRTQSRWGLTLALCNCAGSGPIHELGWLRNETRASCLDDGIDSPGLGRSLAENCPHPQAETPTALDLA